MPSVHTIKAGEFKAKCLKIMDEVARSGDQYIITKRGNPVAKLVPLSYRVSDKDGQRNT